jgi:hypothetical protein
LRTALALSIALVAASSACGDGAPAPPPRAPLAPAATVAAFPDEPGKLPRFHSKRFSLSFPLPDGRSWHIDDHSQPEIVATHAPTRSKLLVLLLPDHDLVNRQRCEAMAREHALVPTGDLRTVEDEVTVGPDAFDTRVWVALETGGAPERPLTGHVLAFGGMLRKCLVFHFTSEVASAQDEGVLSQRLAVARARILGEIKLDDFDAVPREKPRQ